MLGIRRKSEGRKGFALIYVTLIGAFVLIPMGGLAIDFGMLYNIKARLQTACDAAAIGAGYLLHASTNLSDPTQLAGIESAAQAYFNANYPTHYFGSTLTTYNVAVASASTGKTITVNATAAVPMLLMRVLGINNSQVAAIAKSNVRFIAMMIAVDRSGSVFREGAASTIQTALSTFVANSSTSYLIDGVDTVGMVTFGGTWNLDYSPNLHFQTSTPSIGTAITDIDFATDNSTNTAEGLYQAWTQLHVLNLPGSLNVIVLLTDGRPSSFTGSYGVKSSCNGGSNINGVLQAYVGLGWPPPTANSNDVLGLLKTKLTGAYPSWGDEPSNFATPNGGCQYPSNYYNVVTDLTGGNFPNTVGPVDNVGATYNTSYSYYATPGSGVPTQSGYYTNPGTSSNNPQAVRYASFNVADNIATYIRQDTSLAPMLFVIGLNYADTSEEALDEDWLARVANDPTYVTVGSDPNVVTSGNSVYQSGQTAGMYCNSTTATLGVCFEQVTSQLLRLIQ